MYWCNLSHTSRISEPRFRHHFTPLHSVYIKPYAWTNHVQAFVGYKHAFVSCASVNICLHMCTWVRHLQAPESYKHGLSCTCVQLYEQHVYAWMRRLQAFVGYEYALCVIARMASTRMDNESASIWMCYETRPWLLHVCCVCMQKQGPWEDADVLLDPGSVICYSLFFFNVIFNMRQSLQHLRVP